MTSTEFVQCTECGAGYGKAYGHECTGSLLARRLAALESREEVRHRIEPIMRGERPQRGVGKP